MLNIALDPGFGNTKVCIDGSVITIQSAVSRPRAIGMAASGMRTTAIADQVTIAGVDYYAGADSWQWGEPIGGLDYSALAAPARQALFYTCVARLLPPGEHAANLVIGLPVPLMQDEQQYQLLLDALSASYKGQKEFCAPAGDYILDIKSLKAIAQPVGAWADWMIEPDASGSLRARKGAKDAEVAVLDIGMNTLDLYVVQGGRVSPRFIGGAKAGVRRILAQLNGHGQDLEELDALLRARRIKPTREQLDSWLAQIFSTVERVWPDLRRFSAIIPAGGGAMLLSDLLHPALTARGATIAWPIDPLTANARGLWKWLAYTSRR